MMVNLLLKSDIVASDKIVPTILFWSAAAGVKKTDHQQSGYDVHKLNNRIALQQKTRIVFCCSAIANGMRPGESQDIT